MNKMRLAAGFLAACLCVTGLCACKGGRHAENETLIIGNSPSKENNPTGYEKFMENAKAVEKEYPDITIRSDVTRYSVDTFWSYIGSGNSASAYLVPWTEPQKLIQKGYAKDITKQYEKSLFTGIYHDEFMKIVSDDEGHIYGVPNAVYIIGMMCNVKLFKEAGLVNQDGTLKVPDTYEELAKTAGIIRQKTGKPGIAMCTNNAEGGWYFMNIAWSFGVDFVKQVGDKWYSAFNTPECVEAFRYLSDLKWKYDALPSELSLDQQEVARIWSNDEAAIVFMAEELINTSVLTYGMDRDNIATAPLPSGPKGRYALMGGNAYMLLPTVSDRAAEAFMKWVEVTKFYGDVRNTELREKEKLLSVKEEESMGKAIFAPSIDVIADENIKAVDNEIYDKCSNVDSKMYRSIRGEDTITQTEVPVCCQQLYKLLSNDIIRIILADKDANIEELVENASDKLQREYLDKLSV